MTILNSDSRAHQEYYNLMYKMLEPYEEKAKLFYYTFNPKELNQTTQATESAYKTFQEAREKYLANKELKALENELKALENKYRELWKKQEKARAHSIVPDIRCDKDGKFYLYNWITGDKIYLPELKDLQNLTPEYLSYIARFLIAVKVRRLFSYDIGMNHKNVMNTIQ